MILFDSFKKAEKNEIIEMMKTFYTSGVTADEGSIENFERTFQLVIEQSPYVKAFTIKNDQEIVGYCLFSLSYSNEVGGISVWIEELYVKEAYQGKGIGKQMFDFIFDHFKDAARIRLEVDSDNQRAIQLYERLGFHPVPYLQYKIDR